MDFSATFRTPAREAPGTFLHDDSGGDLFRCGVRGGTPDDGDIRDAR